MPQYVDGFLIPVPKKNLAAYRKMAKLASKIWLDHGAVAYRECVGDDLAIPGMSNSFSKVAKLKSNEVVVFAWIVYRSKSDRNKVHAKVMKDPRIASAMPTDGKNPFDMKRMAMAGFKTLVVAGE